MSVDPYDDECFLEEVVFPMELDIFFILSPIFPFQRRLLRNALFTDAKDSERS